jgi:hypothetical protein
MPRKFIRTLWAEAPRPLWNTDHQKEALRNYLNDVGFYVLHGVEDSLDVYVISYENPWDLKVLKKALDKFKKWIKT